MQFSALINQGASFFLIMLTGFLSKKGAILDKDLTKGLTGFLLYVTLPFTIVGSFNSGFSHKMLLNAGAILIASLIIHLSSALLSKFLYTRCPDTQKSVLRFITTFSNAAFMGFPVLESIYGKTGVFYASIYVVALRILIWTLGVKFFTTNREDSPLKQGFLNQVLLNPGIIAVIIGLPLFIFSIKLPIPINKTIEMVGSMTTPLSMLIIGSMLADLKMKDLFSGFYLYYSTLVRLIIIPVLTYTVLSLINFDPTLLGICVLSTAMPAATTTVVVAERYNGDSLYASRSVFITTLFSMLTIPLITLLIQL